MYEHASGAKIINISAVESYFVFFMFF